MPHQYMYLYIYIKPAARDWGLSGKTVILHDRTAVPLWHIALKYFVGFENPIFCSFLVALWMVPRYTSGSCLHKLYLFLHYFSEHVFRHRLLVDLGLYFGPFEPGSMVLL